MNFQNYTSENFVNGYNPTSNTTRGRPRSNQVAPASAPAPDSAPATATAPAPAGMNLPRTSAPPPPPPAAPTQPNVPEAPAAETGSTPAEEQTEEPFTTNQWDVPSTHVLIELFKDFVPRLVSSGSPAERERLKRNVTADYNANAAINGRRNITALTSKWNTLVNMQRDRRRAASATGSAPLAHWEFEEVMELATAQFPTSNPPVIYDSLLGETEDHRAERIPARRRRFQVDEDVEEEVTARRPRNVDASTWLMANRFEEIEERRRQERAEDRAFFREQMAIRQQQMEIRQQQIDRYDLRRQEIAEILRESTLAMNRMTDLLAASIAASTNQNRSSSPATTPSTTSNNKPPSPPSSNDNNV